jgi:histidinol phosphatase-like PHP family hydrolase
MIKPRRGPEGAKPSHALFDHHVHTARSDGRLSLEDRARSVAVRPHGVSDHYPWREKMRGDDDVLRYLDDAARLGLRVGIEYDLGVAPPLRPSTRDALHYLIGAVHQVDLDGVRIAFDEAGRFVKGGSGAATYSEAERFTDPALRQRILERTLALVREGIDEVGIDIVGHPTFSPLVALGDPEDSFPVEWQERLIAMCVDARVALEVNESYRVPHHAFLVRARERGALFSVGTDSHGEIGPLDRTEAMIRDAALPHERFLRGERVRYAGRSTARSS